MSQIIATIKNIRNVDSLNIVEFGFYNHTLKMVSLNLSKQISINKKVQLSIKPTNILIAKNLQGEISISNQLKAKIVKVENGELLSSILLKVEDTILESIITVDSSKNMNLVKDEEVLILIKASDLFIQEVIDE
jgi:molybdopterin-binding protein